MQNKQAIRLLFTANIISGIAQGITMIAIPWYFIDIKGEASLFGAIYAAITLASLVWSLYSGTLIDKYSRKHMFIWVTSIGFVVVGGIAFIGFQIGEVPMWLVATVFGLTMFNYQVHYPTLYAFGQEITAKKDYSKMNSYLEIQGQVANITAGALGALLLSGVDAETLRFFGVNELPFNIEAWKMHEVFLLDASTYLCAAIIISFIKYTPVANRKQDVGSIVQRIKMGVTFLKENKLIFHFGNTSYNVFAFVLLCVHMLLPMYVDNHLEESAGLFSVSYMLYAIGALSAGVWVRKMFKETEFVKGIILLMIICAIGTLVIAFTKSIFLFVIYSLMIGLTNAGVRIMRITYLFKYVPNGIIGRVSSVFHVINILIRFGFISLFSLAYFSENSNIIYAFLISGIFLLASLLVLCFYYKKLAANSILLND
jgi:DHA3 family macrolide efflux protein-like MFS transporter